MTNSFKVSKGRKAKWKTCYGEYGRGKGEMVCRRSVYSASVVVKMGRAEDLVEEMGKDIARFTEEGQVVVAGDWNCKIGRLMSVAREMEYNRRNTSKRIDGRGRRMIELMNANEMVY